MLVLRLCAPVVVDAGLPAVGLRPSLLDCNGNTPRLSATRHLRTQVTAASGHDATMQKAGALLRLTAPVQARVQDAKPTPLELLLTCLR